MFLQHYYSAQNVESSILLADNDDCLYGDLYDALKALDNDYNDEDFLLMAPGCLSKKQQQEPADMSKYVKEDAASAMTTLSEIMLDQIPLPSTPPPSVSDEDERDERDAFEYDNDDNNEEESPTTLTALGAPPMPRVVVKLPAPPPVYDTLDSFEVLEQTVRKQKRLAKKKNTDMRMKVLLKRTFDLVCEIMDHENGFDEDADELINVAKQQQQPSPHLPPTIALPTPAPHQNDLYSNKSVLEVNVKHNDFADEEEEHDKSTGDSNNVVPSSSDDEVASTVVIKRKHVDEEDDEGTAPSDDDVDDEDHNSESRRRPFKRQKFTSEMNDIAAAAAADKNSHWCKDENDESMFDKCKCSSTQQQQKNSVFYQHDEESGTCQHFLSHIITATTTESNSAEL